MSIDSGSMAGLGNSTRRGLAFGGTAQVLQQVLSVLATLALARLLHQSEFGVVAAANSILGLSTLLLAMGLNISVIRKPELTEEFLATIQWASIAVAVVVASLFVLGAPGLAKLFGVQEAAPYLAALAPVVVLNLAASVPLGLLRRRLSFGAFWAVQVLAMSGYVIIEVSLAVAGLGAWAVIIGQLALSVIQFFGAFIAARWVPRLTFRIGLLREEIGFAGGMLGGHALGYGLKNADYWVVGNALGAAALGSYYIAYVLPSVLRVRLTAVVATVLILVFARVQGETAHTRRVYAESMRLLSGAGFPAMVGIAVLAEPITAVFFGAGWKASVDPLRWIALAALLEFLGATASHVAIAHKLVGRLLVAQVIRFVTFVPAAAVAALVWGTLEAVSLSVLASTGVWCIAQQLLVARPLGLGLRLISRDLVAVAVSSAVMGAAVLLLQNAMSDQSAIVNLLAGVVVGTVVYFLIGVFAFRATFCPLILQSRRVIRSAHR